LWPKKQNNFTRLAPAAQQGKAYFTQPGKPLTKKLRVGGLTLGAPPALQAPPQYTVQMWGGLEFSPAVDPSPRRGLEAHLIKT